MSKNKNFKLSLYEWLESIVVALVAVVLIFIFVFRTYVVSGSSMEPTLTNGNRVAVLSLFYAPVQNDVVVIDGNVFNGNSLVKRVIAVEGQQISINGSGEIEVDGEVFGNIGTSNQKQFLNDYIELPSVVPKNKVFVLGDNRSASHDSRFSDIGFIDNDNIIGKVIFVLSPFGFIGD
ncbi:MAG: signal peptidase I [Ruminococcaceae bacterium]|nr:signal peptidase I [Oscillospiraceae bacterium]